MQQCGTWHPSSWHPSWHPSKKLDVDEFKHADLYQLLAYTTATGLDAGLLIYAAGESPAGTVLVPMAGKTLRITTLGLQGSPSAILREVAAIGEVITSLRSGRKGYGQVLAG